MSSWHSGGKTTIDRHNDFFTIRLIVLATQQFRLTKCWFSIAERFVVRCRCYLLNYWNGSAIGQAVRKWFEMSCGLNDFQWSILLEWFVRNSDSESRRMPLPVWAFGEKTMSYPRDYPFTTWTMFEQCLRSVYTESVNYRKFISLALLELIVSNWRYVGQY